MVDITNIGVPMVISRGFVPLAIESGIVPVIYSLVSYATDKRSLLIALKEVVAEYNQGLAVTLNYETLDALLAYINLLGDAPIMTADRLPVLLNENGPVSVSAGRDGGAPTQINITYSEPPSGYTAEIYLDGVFVKHDETAPSGGFVNTFISDVAITGTNRVIRVLYRTSDGNQTRFGPIQTMA